MFSVVISLYNKELSIGNTIRSVLNQTYQDFEIVIVNDGSTDKSLQVVEQINDSRIRIINKPNGGVSSARNRGIKEASREWIAFLDGDDLWKENHLNTFQLNIEANDKILIFSNSFAYMINNQLIHAQNLKSGIIDNYFKIAINEPVIHTSSVCINKKIFEDIGVFNENMTHGEDLDLWARIGKKYPIFHSSIVQAIYQKGIDGQVTCKMPNVINSIAYHLNFKEYGDYYEMKYYKKIVVSRFFSYIKRKKIRYAFKLYYKYKKDIKVKDYIGFMVRKYKPQEKQNQSE